MVRRLKRQRHRNLLRIGLVLLPLSVVLAAVGILLAPLPGDAATLQSLAASVVLGLAGAALVLGISLPMAKYISGWCYDPNSEEEVIRRRSGQAPASSNVDYDSAKVIPTAGE
jgi:hypothetical protein